MARTKKRDLSSADVLPEIHRLTGAAILRELRRHEDAPQERIDASLLSAAVAFLRLESGRHHEAPRDEAPAAASAPFNFTPRAGVLADDEETDSLSAFCAARGITEDDTENIIKLAKHAASTLPPGSPEAELYLSIANEAQQ